MKVIPKKRLLNHGNGSLIKYAMTEKKVLSQVNHPYIVKL